MGIKNLIRIGQISSTNEGSCSARVVFDDKDNMVSAELPIITRGSLKTKDYWLPDIGEQVLCLFLPNGNNLTQGFILGTYFSGVDVPNTDSVHKRKIDFGDGTTVEYNRASHELAIHCVGAVNLYAAGGDIVVNGISLVHHRHPGCQGGSTGPAQ